MSYLLSYTVGLVSTRLMDVIGGDEESLKLTVNDPIIDVTIDRQRIIDLEALCDILDVVINVTPFGFNEDKSKAFCVIGGVLERQTVVIRICVYNKT